MGCRLGYALYVEQHQTIFHAKSSLKIIWLCGALTSLRGNILPPIGKNRNFF
tara:strand:+ start:67 stop:222 length:156 start_codon:yes stop_codon:yes gene_type:complete